MFKHYSSQYLKIIASYYYKMNSNLNYLLSVKTHNSVQQANSLNKIHMKTKESSSLKLIKLNKHEGTRAKHDSSYEKIKKTHNKDKHENPMRCSRLKWSVFLSHTKKSWVLTCYKQQAKLKKTRK